jgi:predicted transcriptional regulator
MAKTITVRVDDDVYSMFRTAARGVHRTISNFIEFATLSYITNETYVSDREMEEIRSDKALMASIRRGIKDAKEGRYRIVS